MFQQWLKICGAEAVFLFSICFINMIVTGKQH